MGTSLSVVMSADTSRPVTASGSAGGGALVGAAPMGFTPAAGGLPLLSKVQLSVCVTILVVQTLIISICVSVFMPHLYGKLGNVTNITNTTSGPMTTVQLFDLTTKPVV